MNTGRILGPKRASRQWRTFGLILTFCFSLFSDNALSQEKHSRLRARKVMKPEHQVSETLARPQTFSNQRMQLEGMMRLGSQMISDDTDEGANASFGFGLKFNYKFIDWLKLRSETNLSFSKERYQAQIDDDRFSDGFSVKEAVAVVAPNRYFELGAGAVKQSGKGSSPLLISNRAFPGVYEKVQYRTKKAYVAVKFGQAMPTSRSFDSNRQEKEKSPYYFTESLMAGYRPNRYFRVEPFVTHYRYENLPSVVAFNSVNRGNTILDPQPTNSNFEFQFSGFLGGMRTEVRPTSRISLIGEYHYIQNDSAPETFNKGQFLSLALKARYRQMTFEPNLGSFYNESDTSPGFYNSGELGHSNREGKFYGFDVAFDRYNFKIGADYVVADVVNPNEDRQSDLKYFVVTVETLYVEF